MVNFHVPEICFIALSKSTEHQKIRLHSMLHVLINNIPINKEIIKRLPTKYNCGM